MKYLGTKSSNDSIATVSDLNAAVDNIQSGIDDAKKEANHLWGGRAIVNGMSPNDASMLAEMSANRLLGFPLENFEFQFYNGNTWSNDNTITKSDLNYLLGGSSSRFRIGNNDTPRPIQKMRCTFTVIKSSEQSSCLYCVTKKLLVKISSGGMSNLRIKVSASEIGSTVFSELVDVPVSGWPGWNSIPLEIMLGGSSSQSNGHYGAIRLELYSTLSTSTQNQYPVRIESIRLIAPTLYSSTYALAKENRPYELDPNGFPVFGRIILKNGDKFASLFLDSDGRLVVNDSSGTHLV